MATNYANHDTEYLFNLRALLDDSIKKLPHKLKRSLSLFLDSALVCKDIDFSDLKKRGAYDGLLLGANNPTLLNDFFGVQPKGFIKDDAPYLIEVERTFRDSTLLFELAERKGVLPRSKQDILVRLFKKYNPETDIEKFVDADKLPALVIKDFDISFLVEPDEDVKLLLGEDLVRKIKIGIPGASNDLIYPKLRSIHIITPGFVGLQENFGKDKKIYFSKPLSNYNFIFLNDNNDFLVKSFFDSIAEFEANHGLPNVLAGLHKTLFFVKDMNYFSKTRLANEKPEYQRFLDVAYFDALEYKREPASYSSVLNYLLLLCSEVGIQRAREIETAARLAGSAQAVYSDFQGVVTMDGSQLLSLFEELKSSLLILTTKYIASDTDVFKDNRDVFFTEYESFLKALLSFVSKYLRTKENINFISQITQDAIKGKEKFIQKESRFIFMESYVASQQDFKLFILSKLEALKAFFDFIPQKIQIESLNLLFTELDRQSSKSLAFENYLETQKLLGNLEKVASLELIRLIDH
jgi:hypothetical protein